MPKRFKQCSVMFVIGIVMALTVKYAGLWIASSVWFGYFIVSVLYSFATFLFFFGTVIMVGDYYAEYREEKERKRKFKIIPD